MNIHFDEQGIGIGNRKNRWDELVAVGIRTTADGPFGEDVFWHFLLRDSAFELPGMMVNSDALRALQEHLPGIDSIKIISAMGSTEERIWRIWHVEEARSRWDDAVFGARFAALVERLGGAASKGDAFLRLRAAWSEKERRYHDLEHLTDCLRELDSARVDSGTKGVAELALWYHDAVYTPLARDSEERSALLLQDECAELGIREDIGLAAAACVRATAHLDRGAAPSGPVADLVVDIDLSILGRDVLRFMEFEYAAREEYAAVSMLRYTLARGHFLAGLLAAPAIFRTAHFRERYESRARANLTALLESPRYRAHRWFGRFRR